MVATLPLVLAILAPAPQAQVRANPEAAVSAALEEVRKGELFLDADTLAASIAASFTLIEGGSRISGSFAYLEPIRRLRERGGKVKELRFQDVAVRVYGASAVVSYRFSKSWSDGSTHHHAEGWSTDVFELRDDGAWILVHRQRCR
jgi:ketosteroid isomerase-like protein